MTNPIPARLAALRDAMQQHGVAAVLVPSADPHLSEYLPEHWQARDWLSGFTGSAGTLHRHRATMPACGPTRAISRRPSSNWPAAASTLMKLRVPHTPEHLEWLQQAPA